jgi:hypothetical protein
LLNGTTKWLRDATRTHFRDPGPRPCGGDTTLKIGGSCFVLADPFQGNHASPNARAPERQDSTTLSFIFPERCVDVPRVKQNPTRPQMPEDVRKVKLIYTTTQPGHQRNFIDSVKSRQPTVTPVEVAHHSAIPGHLGLIAMLVGRKIKWDPDRERIIGDSEASKLLTRPYRSPWKLA